MTKSFRDCEKVNQSFQLVKQNQSKHSSNPYRADRPYPADKPSYSDTMTRIMQANRLARAPMLVGSSATAHLATAHLSASSPGAGKRLRSSHATHFSHTAFALSVSAAALSLSLASGAQAQNTIPAECNPSSLVAGGTLTCVLEAPATLGPIVTTVDGVTIIIGEDGTPTTVMTASGNALSATIANDGTGDITINSEFGIISGGENGIRTTNAGTGAITITAASVTGQAGDGISATTAGRNISISGAHTVLGTGGRGIFAMSNGGNISIQGVGLTDGVQGSAGHGIFADARGGSNGNINIGGITAIGDVSGSGSGSNGILAHTRGTGRSITIDASGGSVSGDSSSHAIAAYNPGFGASSISITTADATSTGNDGIHAIINNTQSTGALMIDSSAGAVMGRNRGIFARSRSRGTTDITVGDVSASNGIGIFAHTRAGANITVNAGGTVSGSSAIQTGVIAGDTNLPADRVTIIGSVTGNIRTLRGADTVILAAGSITTGIRIDLGEEEDTLDLASTTFGTLDGGTGADTLSVSGTGITLAASGASAVSGFETFAFTAGSNTLRGTHAGLASSSIATGAMLDLAAGSSLSGDLANSGMLTIAGEGFGSVTITGGLTLNAGGTLSLDTNGAGGETDLLTVTRDVTVDGTLALTQTTMPSGTVVLIDGGAALSGTFASTTGLVTGLLINQAIAYDRPSGQVRLVTSVRMIDSAFPTGCAVTPTSPLADGGTLTCISATPITDPIATTVDGVTIIIGESNTPTTLDATSGIALSAAIASDGTGDISINSEFGIISGGTGGISANNAGTGSISITTAAVTGSGTNADGIVATLDNSNAAGNLSITATGAVSGSRHGISAMQNGSGTLTIDASTAGAIGGISEGQFGISVVSGGTGTISVMNAGTGETGSRAISIASSGAISGAAGGIAATHSGDGAISISSSNSVTGNAGSAISATTVGGNISISGAHTVLGTGGHGIEAISGGGDISIQGVGLTGGVTGTAEHGIFADARGGSGGNINIGDTTPLGTITVTDNRGIYARTDGTDSSITIDASGGAVIGSGIDVVNTGTRASAITITAATVTARVFASGIRAQIYNSDATGDISITTTGVIMGLAHGIIALNYGSGATTITTDSAMGDAGRGIFTGTRTGASIIVNAGGTISGSVTAIQTTTPSRDRTARPADSITIRGTVSGGRILTFSGVDTVSLMAGSTTTGTTIDLGADDDSLDLASPAFGTLDGGEGADTLSISGTGITLDGGAHANFETLIFAAGAGSNTLSGIHTDITTTNFDAGTTTLSGSLTSTTAAVASGAMLDLAAGSSLAGDLANSGMLTVAGSGFGSATITGGLTLNADGSLTLDTNGAGGETDLLMVSGAVTIGGTLALTQTTMPDGTVVLIDGASLSGTFATTTGLISAPLISQAIAYDRPSGQVRLVTTVMVLPDSSFPTSCTVIPVSPLAAGGTLTCISADTITEAIATTVDGVTIIIGESATQTTVMTASGDAINARIASGGTGDININSEFGTITGGTSGIDVTNAGTGSISLTTSAVTGTSADGINARLNNSRATGDLSITTTGAVSGSRHGISAQQNGSGTLTIDASTAGAIGGTDEGDVGILATSTGSGAISVMNAGTGGTGSRAIRITSSGAISGAEEGISATHTGDGAISITSSNSVTGNVGDGITAITAGGAIMISAAAVTGRNLIFGVKPLANGIYAGMVDLDATGDIFITTTDAVIAVAQGIYVRNYGSGATRITTASVTTEAGSGIAARTTVGATIIVNAGGTVSGGFSAIRTDSPRGSSALPADSVTIRGSVSRGNIFTLTGADSVTLAATSTTTGIIVSLGAGDDRLDLASVAFGTLNGGADADTLSVTGTGITLDGGAVSGFETLAFTAGSNTLSGTHTGLISSRIETGAILDLAAGSSLTGDLANSGMLTVAGSGFGSVTIGGGLTLNAGGTLSLDTNGAGGETDLLMVSGAVTVGGTLALTQTTMPNGTVVLIDGASLSGTFAITAGLLTSLLIHQAIAYDRPSGQVRLVTTVIVPAIDPAFPDGCLVTPVSPLADGGTLTCISATPITEAIATTVDGVTIVIGQSDTTTTVMTASGDGLSASIAGTSATGNISINSEFGIISGGENGIYALNAGTGGIRITTSAVTGTAADGIDARLNNTSATGDLSITATGAVSGSRHGISAMQNGSGTLTIDASRVGAIGGAGNDGIRVVSSGTGAISVMNAGTGGTGSRSISIISSGVVSGAAGGIAATHTGDGVVSITSSNSVTGNAGSAISATTAGGAITISGAHTVLGTGGRGIEAISGGGNISIQGVGETGGVQGTTGNGIFADASGGSSGNINIGGMTELGAITGIGSDNSGINALTDGAGSSITIDASGGAVMGGNHGISVSNTGTGASGISITAAAVTGGNSASGISASLSNSAATGDISITASGAVMGGSRSIIALNYGSGTTSITVSSASASAGSGIFTRTRAGASITVNAGSTVSGGGGSAAIQTTVPRGDISSTPSDRVIIRGTVSGGNIVTGSSNDIVTLAAGSTTTGITIDLGESNDRLDLASATFGTLDGGVDRDTLRMTGTGITLDGGAHLNFETFIFMAGSNTLSGTHTGLDSSKINAGATLDLAAGSSLAGRLSNSGMLTVAGAGFGSATITGDLVLNADGTLTLDTNGMGNANDRLMVSGAVTLGGTLMLRQTTMPAGMVILIDGGTSLTGDFANSNEMSTEGLVNGLLISQELVRDTTNFDLQLVTTVLVFDSAFPTGCTVAPVSPLADGGTLTCISATPITEAIATTVDGVTIVIGQSDTTTSVMNASGDGLSASIASTSAAGNISINSEFGIISGGANGIVASSAGTGSISITAAATTGSGTNADGIVATLDNSNAVGNLSITATGAVSGSRHGISAMQNGSGTLTIDASTAGAIGGTDEGDVGILATSDGTGAISVMNAGTGGSGSRAISITSSGAVSGAMGGISATHTGDGAVSITSSNSVTGQAGDAISATTAGGDITISGAHTVLGTGGRGIEAISGGGDISIQGVGETGGVRGSAEDGIYADASGGTGGNINIGDMTAIGNVTSGGTENRGINAQTDGTDSSITIDTSSGTVMSDGLGSTVIAATNAGTGGISITTADVTATSSGSGGIFAQISDAGAASAILIDSSAGTVSGLGAGISVVNAGSGTTTITTASVTGGNSGIFTRTTAGASITVNVGAILSTSGRFAIQPVLPVAIRLPRQAIGSPLWAPSLATSRP